MVSKGVGIAVVAVLAVAVILVANSSGFFGSTPQVNNIIPGTSTPTPDTSGNVPTGTLVMGVTHVNSENLGTTFTDATNVEVKYWYKGTGGNYVYEATSGSGTANINLDGVSTEVWGEIEIPSGQAYLVDADSTMNDIADRVGTCIRADPDDDRFDDWMCPIRITGLNPTDSDATELSWKTFIWEDDGASVTLTSPVDADTDALGTGGADCDIDWRLQFSADAHAGVIGTLDLTVNATSTADYSESKSNISVPSISGSETISLSDSRWDKNIDNSNGNTIYTLDFGNGDDVDQGKTIVIPNNQGNLKVDIPVTIFTDYESSDANDVTLGVTFIDAQGDAQTEITDVVVCAES